MKKNTILIIQTFFLLFILNVSCQKEPIPARGELNAWIREDFANEDITLRIDSAEVFIEYTNNLETDFIPLVIELHKNEELKAGRGCKVEGNVLLIDVSYLKIVNPQKSQPICDNLVTPITIRDSHYNIFVSLCLAY